MKTASPGFAPKRVAYAAATLVLSTAVLVACGGSDDSDPPPSTPQPPAVQGRWTTGDLHVHTMQSDDAQQVSTLDKVLASAFDRFGLDWATLSDQLRVQLAASTQTSQLNLGHIIHQQDNYRGGLRGQGFELRTDGYACLRGGAGVLLSTYHGPSGIRLEPTADFAAGMALLQHLSTLSQSLDGAATTHQSVRLPGHAGSHQANASLMDADNAPHAALLRSASTLVDSDCTEQALGEAALKDPATGKLRVPHTGDAVIAAAAKGGLLAIAGQHLQINAGEDISLASGGSINLALNAQARLHTGQAIGLLAAAARADHEGTEGRTGLSVIAASDSLDIQAQTDTLKIQSKEQLTLQSASAAVELAAAGKIRIATAQGAAITLEGGNIRFEAPGSITYKASMRTLQGPVQGGYALPLFPQSVCIPCLLKAMQSGSPLAAVLPA